MNWEELDAEVIALLGEKEPDDVIAWVDNINDLAEAKAKIKKLAMVVLWLAYNKNFIIGNKNDT